METSERVALPRGREVTWKPEVGFATLFVEETGRATAKEVLMGGTGGILVCEGGPFDIDLRLNSFPSKDLEDLADRTERASVDFSLSRLDTQLNNEGRLEPVDVVDFVGLLGGTNGACC
jgi:hypothetical protein